MGDFWETFERQRQRQRQRQKSDLDSIRNSCDVFRHREKVDVKLGTFALLDGGVGGLLGKYTTAMRKVRMAGTDKRSR